MLEFSFFEVFLCAQSELSEEKSAWERDNINNHERRAQTWFFWTCVLSKGGKTFSDLLSACKKQLDTSITTALVITWAFADTAGPVLDMSHKVWIACIQRALCKPLLQFGWDH